MRNWRPMTWVLWIWTLLMFVWMIGGAASATNGDCDLEATAELRQLCQDATDVGASLAVALLFVLWALGFLALAMVWLMTRPSEARTIRG